HDYMEVFGEATTVVEAQALLEKNKELFSENPIFFLDLADYFRVRWKDGNTSNVLLKEVLKRFQENIPALRSLAYRYDILGRKNEALDLFLRILELDPSAAQSYYDLADAYSEKGNDKKATEVFDRYMHHRKSDSIPFDKYGADLFMTIGSLNNTQSRKEKINWEKLLRETEVEISFTRVVATWSNPNIN